MKTKRISAARLLLVSDRNGDTLWEPRLAPLMNETLGISQRAELARRAMASPVERSKPEMPPNNYETAAPNGFRRSAMVVLFGLAFCLWLVIAGLGVLVWSWL